jgi:hypothetical protein
VAKKLGITASEIDRMASAFEHEDLSMAVAMRASGKTGKPPRER